MNMTRIQADMHSNLNVSVDILRAVFRITRIDPAMQSQIKIFISSTPKKELVKIIWSKYELQYGKQKVKKNFGFINWMLLSRAKSMRIHAD